MLDKALRIDPAHAPAHTNHGMALLTEGLAHTALAHFERATAADPSCPDAQLGLAIASEDARSLPLEEVDLAYQAALRSEPLGAQGHYAYGRFLKGRRADPAAAERCYRTALDVAPDDVNALLSYGTLLCDAGEFARAEECYKRALRVQPLNPNTLYSYAMLLCRWERVFARGPGAPPAFTPRAARNPRLMTADLYFRKACAPPHTSTHPSGGPGFVPSAGLVALCAARRPALRQSMRQHVPAPLQSVSNAQVY